uniref:Major-capsid protein n=1 Tax=Malaco herpesvirus 1 TaxID=3031797 RepID=A0AA48P8E2_9VIRU|nr:TPA_asm: major-capsid protein [Malaco herpesvirus 1]
MTTPYVNPNGAGISVGRVGPNTANLGSMGSREIMKGLVRGMVNGVNSAQGMFAGGIDLTATFNLDKNAVRKVIFSTVQRNDAVNKSSLSHAANICLATTANDNLYDEITQQMLAPAGVALHSGVIPSTSEDLSIVRKYDSETRVTAFTLEEEVIKFIHEMQMQIFNENQILLTQASLNNRVMDEMRINTAKGLLTQLHRLISHKINTAKISSMMGIEESIYDAVRRYAVEPALLETADKFSDSITQTMKGGDVIKKLRERNTFTAFAKAYCEKLVEQMFIMAKNPQGFVGWLSDISDKFSRNLVNEAKTDPNADVVGLGGGRMPISKVMIVGESVHDQLKGVEGGNRTGILPVGFYDNTDFYTKENVVMLYSREDNKKVEESTLAARRDIANLVQEGNLNLDGTVTNLSPLGERIFSLNDSKPEGDLAPMDSGRLYDVPVNDPCQFIQGKDGAIVINKRNDIRLGPLHEAKPDHSVSGKSMTNLVMKASLGDTDYTDPDLTSWMEKLLSDKVTAASAVNKFGINDIITKTDTISTKEVKFTKTHLAMAVADPSLWSYPTEEVNNLTKFFEEKGGNMHPSMRDLRNMVAGMVLKFKNKRNLVNQYYDDNSEIAANELSFTELSPFHDYSIEDPDTGKIVGKPRQHIGALPAYLVDLCEHLRFANIAMEDKESVKKLMSLATSEEGDTAVEDNPELLRELKRIIKRLYPHVVNLDLIIDTRDEFLKAFVTYPTFRDSNSYSFSQAGLGLNNTNWKERANSDSEFGKAGTCYTYHANIEKIVKNHSLSRPMKLLILLGMARKATPYALVQNVESRLPIGVTLDVVKVEKLYNNSVYMATPKAVDVIVTPEPTTSEQLADKSKIFKMQTRVQAVNNMAGGSSIVVPNALPCQRIDHVSTDSAGNPLICLDHITMSRYYSGIRHWLNKINYENEDSTVMQRLYNDAEQQRLRTAKNRAGHAKQDSFVLFLRPASDLSKNKNLTPFMGMPRYNSVVGETSTMPMVNFYTSPNAFNPWIARLGAVYNQRYVHGGQVISSQDGGESVSMQTLTVDAGARNLSETTMLFLNAFDFETYMYSDLSPFQEKVVADRLNYRGGATFSTNKPDKFQRTTPATGDEYLSSLHQLARMGMTVPCTVYSNEKVLRMAREGRVQVLSTEIGHAVISPISG